MEEKKSMEDVGRIIEAMKKEAYERGYEDGYDAGCMDLVDEEEDTW